MTGTVIRHPAVLASGRPEYPARQLLVVDDYVIFAEALVCRLNAEPGVSAAAATTIEEARWMLGERRFDVLLLDLDLGGSDGLRFAVEVMADYPGMRVVVVTAGEDQSQVTDAVKIGVSGWVPKSEPVEHLLTVIAGALRGETWIPPKLLTHVLTELKSAQRERSEHETLLDRLTRREKEVLSWLATGMSLDAIATELYLSRNTVRTHVQNMLGKLNVHSAVAAVAVARRAGIYGPGARLLESDARASRRH
jgi:DNA-binding NarL/FixJ family response regulator